MAIATPPGRGGIGIVRLSGPGAALLLAPVLDLRRPLEHGRARVGAVRDPAEAGAILDQAVVTYFAAPRSYTGEDVLEVAVHGAPVLLQFLVRSALAAGARLAEPGEFTQRAFLSGRLDLTQAEAVHALVAASTLHQARVAAAQLGGAISRAVAPAKEALLQLIAALEAGIDFAEDDIDLTSDAEIARQIAEVTAPLAALERSFAYGGIVRDGVTLALVGRPNAGKSSLFNRLLERERAIVTAQPGTTRDPITERLAIGGIPVELVDTAGLRAEPEGEAEAEGIRRSQLALAEADFVLHVLDATVPADEPAWPLAAAGERLTVVNKVDLAPQAAVPSDAIAVSAKTGAGVEALRERLHAMITAAWETERDAPLVTNLRQQQAISAALASLVKAAAAAGQRLPHEFLLLDLYDALAALDTLTGATHSDEVLHRIFAGFCIGK